MNACLLLLKTVKHYVSVETVALAIIVFEGTIENSTAQPRKPSSCLMFNVPFLFPAIEPPFVPFLCHQLVLLHLPAEHGSSLQTSASVRPPPPAPHTTPLPPNGGPGRAFYLICLQLPSAKPSCTDTHTGTSLLKTGLWLSVTFRVKSALLPVGCVAAWLLRSSSSVPPALPPLLPSDLVAALPGCRQVF